MEVKVKVREDAAAEEEDEQPVSAVQCSAVQCSPVHPVKDSIEAPVNYGCLACTRHQISPSHRACRPSHPSKPSPVQAVTVTKDVRQP